MNQQIPVLGNPDDIFLIYPLMRMCTFATHRHHFYEISYFASGTGKLVLPHTEIEITTPCLHFCPPAPAWHHIEVDGNQLIATSLAVYPFMLQSLTSDQPVPHHHAGEIVDATQCIMDLCNAKLPIIPLTPTAARQVEELFSVMCEEYRLRLPGYIIRLRASIEQLIVIATRENQGLHVYPAVTDTSDQAPSPTPSLLPSTDSQLNIERDIRIAQALRWMKTNLSTTMTNRELAESQSLTEKHFVRLFSSEVGISPQKYHLRLRLESAADNLLHTDDSINDIARKFGFSHASHFHRRFREYYGTTPSLYRYFNRQYQNPSLIRH